MNSFPQFAVLRGFASVWVFIGHISMITGLSISFIPSGELAVELFMILSGFVITLLRIKKNEPYIVYVFRRFMRLYPMFLIALILGLLSMHLYLPVLGYSPLFTGDAQRFIARETSISNYFVQHIFAHLTMLHGAIPDSSLPQSALAISGPLWSISLEWQFYLIAPLLIWALDFRTKKYLIFAIGLLAVFLTMYISKHYWTPARVPAFLPQRIDFFVLGIFCGVAWQSSLKNNLLKLSVFSFIAFISFTLILHHNKIPLMLWFSVYLITAAENKFLYLFYVNKILSSKVATWIGDRSYGLYVLHMPIIMSVAYYLVLPYAATLKKSGCFLAIFVISVPIILILISLCYKFIELPTIRWAKNFKMRPVTKYSI